ncbi:MAG: PAS domain-containing protein [Gemmatimonadota bacterium]|nr:PAS domain-containing protein [Gemmatimonadota bacterium]
MLHANANAMALLGASRAETVGAGLGRFITRGDGSADWSRECGATDVEPVCRFDGASGLRRDGVRIPVSIAAIRWRSGAGRFVSAFIWDMRHTLAVEAAAHLHSAALEAAANAIVITERDGKIVWANPAFGSLSGYTLDECVGRNPRDLVKSGVHGREFYAEMWRVLLAGDVWRGEIVNRKKDGTRYPEDLTITPVRDDAGAITHFIAIKRDLSGEKELQQRYLHSQKMESVGQLAAGLAHDFNNLLTVINSTAEFATRALPVPSPITADLEEIQMAGERAAALTRQLLAFARKQIVRPEVFAVGARIESVEPMLRRLLGERIQFAVMVAPDAGAVLADPGQVDQAVMNLVVNARDAMPRGGSLSIEAQAVDVADGDATARGVSAGPYVAIVVADTGVGMPPDVRERLFEPFFTTKAPGKGSGLGLATVYGIMQQSGGAVTVESEEGVGTRMTLLFPRVTESAARADDDRPTVQSGNGERVLVVEDDRAVRELTRRILSAGGYEVVTAADGYDALRTIDLAQEPFDLLFTDVVMPGMSGQALATRVSSTQPLLRILYTSGYTDDEILRHGVLSRDTDFVAKPYTSRGLLDAVRQTLDRRTAGSVVTAASPAVATAAARDSA